MREIAIMTSKSKYRAIGVMSGTSLDGLDIACCVFEKSRKGWAYELEHATTVKYTAQWLDRLSNAHTLTGEELMALDADFGTWIGKTVRRFCDRQGVRQVDFISSHGHTVFHQPDRGFTTQVGNGYSIFTAAGFPVVCDFRTQDVALGGQGAPLVPAGDKMLFHDYDVCLNLGGIANLSLDTKGKRIAYDICFCNMALNMLAAERSQPYDKNGAMASEGEVDKPVLKALRKLYARYHSNRPSLGREIFEQRFAGLLTDKRIPTEDRLCTVTESIAVEVCDAIASQRKSASVLCTGGGAFNGFLMSRLLAHGGDDITFIVPEEAVVKFKEAIVFAFLGVLRTRGEINCLQSVTGAIRDSSSGTMIGF